MEFIQTDNINDILSIHKKIFEFDFPIKSYYKKKEKYNNILIFLYLKDGEYIGYSIIIDQKEDKNFYAWYGGLIPEFQGKGLNSIFIDYLINLAKELNYTSITLATTNKRPNMMILAIKKGFQIFDIKKRETGEGNKIYFKYLC